MRTQLAISIDSFLERYFPERRVFLRSDKDTRFIRLRPLVQLFAFSGAALVVAWSIIATAILLMDSIGAGNFREQAKRDQQTYQSRLNFIPVPVSYTPSTLPTKEEGARYFGAPRSNNNRT